MDEIKSKLDKISDDIVEIKITLASQAVDVAHHIKRSDLLEEKLEVLKQGLDADLKPIKDHVSQMDGIKAATMFALKILAVSAAVLTAFAKAKGLF